MKKANWLIRYWLLVVSHWLFVNGHSLLNWGYPVERSRNRFPFASLFIVPVLMCCLVHMNAKAQDAGEELKKISAWYMDRQSFETNFDYLLYTDAGMKKQVEKQQGTYCRAGNKSYMKGLATETVKNEAYSVTVNHQEKMILASRIAEQRKEEAGVDQAELLKQYASGSGQLSYKKIDNSSSEITMIKDAGPYAAIKVIYNHKQHILTELHLLFRNTDGINWTYGTKQPYLVIRYYGLKYDHRISPSLFDEKRFIIIATDTRKVKPTAAFSRYQVFSTIN